MTRLFHMLALLGCFLVTATKTSGGLEVGHIRNPSTATLAQTENNEGRSSETGYFHPSKEVQDRRLDEYWGAYDSTYDSGYDNDYEDDDTDKESMTGWGALFVFGSMALVGLFPFTIIVSFCVLGPLAKEYRSKGKRIMGLVTGAKKKVRQDFHATTTPGLLYGGYINGTTTETTTNRILDVEYPVVVHGERRIVRKSFRLLHKKTFDRPEQTGEVELYLLTERGVLSAYPRDEFHLSALEKCKETTMFVCLVILFVVLFVFGIGAGKYWWGYFVVFGVDSIFGVTMCAVFRHRMLRNGKILRFVPGQDLQDAFNFDVYDETQTDGHHDDVEIMKSIPPTQKGLPMENAPTLAANQEHHSSKPRSGKEKTSTNSSRPQSPTKTKGGSTKQAERDEFSNPPANPDSIPFATAFQNTPDRADKANQEEHSPRPRRGKRKQGSSSPSRSARKNLPPLPASPLSSDVCFGDESHPGTIAWRNAVEASMEEHAEDDYCAPVHRAIRNLLGKSSRFFIKTNDGEGKWKEASLSETVHQFRLAFEEEQAKFFRSCQ